jgi:hypothetical protein
MKLSGTGDSFLSMPVVWRVYEMSMDKQYLISHVFVLKYHIIRNICAKIHSCMCALFQKLNSVINVYMNILWPKINFSPLYTEWLGVAAEPLTGTWEVLSYNLRWNSGILTEIFHRFPWVPLDKWRGSTIGQDQPLTNFFLFISKVRLDLLAAESHKITAKKNLYVVSKESGRWHCIDKCYLRLWFGHL